MADHACPDCGAVHPEKRVSLKQRVEMLEARIAALEARTPQWSWTMPQVYYDGTVTTSTTTTTDDITIND